MNCKDCYHSDVCGFECDDALTFCKDFKDKSRIIELPCKVGDTVYRIIPKCHPEFGECPFDGGHGYSRCNGGYKKCNAYIEEETFDYFYIKCIGKNVFLTKKEAEAKLKELNDNEMSI